MKAPRLSKGAQLALVLATCLVGAGAAFAINVDFNPIPVWNQGGIWVMPSSLGAQITATNKVTRMLAGSETFDFANTTIVCEDSTGVTVTGAQVGDTCHVGLPAAPGNGSFTCYVSAANTVKVHFCPAGTAVNPASQAYTTRLTSNQ